MAAIEGRIRPHHVKMIGFSLEHIDFLKRQVEAIEEEIEANIAPLGEARELICTIPRIEKAAATEILAEIGADMSVFQSDAHLSSWAGVSPGNSRVPGSQRAAAQPRADGTSTRRWSSPHGRRLVPRAPDCPGAIGG